MFGGVFCMRIKLYWFGVGFVLVKVKDKKYENFVIGVR